MKSFTVVFLFFAGFPLTAFSQKDFQKKIQTQLILAKPGAVIELPEGTFTLSNTLSLEGKSDIIIRGKGIDKTILSFKGQTDGAEGIRVSNGSNILLEGFTVQDAKGDGLKVMHVAGIHFLEVKAEWTGTPGPENGGYGIYPVQCQGVVIDKCVAIGASDAGIYVGQSTDIIVKHSTAFHNVAGIEIENSLRAEVYENETYENTGGILVFDLPDLIQKRGGQVKVHHNKIHNNNFANFAPKGNIVATVPSGTGMLILASKEVEIYQNEIVDNQSFSTGIISYLTTGRPIKDSAYDPFTSAIYIHDNLYERKTGLPVGNDPLSGLVGKKFGENVPHIVYDGIKNPSSLDATGNWLDGHCIAIVNNKNQSIVNLDAAHNFKGIAIVTEGFNCDKK